MQTVYIRRVERVNGLLYNIEFEKYPDVEDPGNSDSEADGFRRRQSEVSHMTAAGAILWVAGGRHPSPEKSLCPIQDITADSVLSLYGTKPCVATRETAMVAIEEARRNHLLAALPATDLARLAGQMSIEHQELGDSIYESGAQLKQVFFPMTSVISLLYVMLDGSSAEIAVVGFEGVVGVSIFMGGNTTPSRAVVQSAGESLVLSAKQVHDEFGRGGPLHGLLLRYTQALITQMAQTAVCNRHHTVDQQLCRWLLLSLDRLQSNELRMTQQLIADMLGVSRGGVTEAAGNLQAAGIIDYARGRITVIDRLALERSVCECYSVVRKEYDRLLHVVA